jgi:hypothetical protein
MNDMPVSDGEHHHGTVGVTLKTCQCRDLLVLLVADSTREAPPLSEILQRSRSVSGSVQNLLARLRLSDDGSESLAAGQTTKLLTWGSPLDKAIYNGSQLALGILSTRPCLREKRSPHGKAFYRLLTALSACRSSTDMRATSVTGTQDCHQPALQNGLSLHQLVQMTFATASERLMIC